MKSTNYLCDGYMITKGETMLNFKDVNKVYNGYKQKTQLVQPAIIGNDYNIQLSITNLNDNQNETVILNEYQARNLQKQLTNFLQYIYELKKESKSNEKINSETIQ